MTETPTQPTRSQIRKWRQYLANERAEAATYRELAKKREGDEREILEEIADAESRHEKYWRDKLGPEVGTVSYTHLTLPTNREV